MRTEEYLIEINNVRLKCKRIISSTINLKNQFVILLHEGLGSIGQWKRFPEKLVELTGHNIFLYERQGHGGSDKLTERKGIDYLHLEAKVLKEVIDLHDFKRYSLIGHSDGGSIALIHAATKPKGLLNVVTLSANIFNQSCIVESINEVTKLYHKEKSNLKSGLYKHHKDKTDELFNSWCSIWTSKEFENWNIKPEIKDIKVPLLAIHGDKDEYSNLEQILFIQKSKIKKTKTVVINGCGHFPHLSHQDKVLKDISKFLLTLKFISS